MAPQSDIDVAAVVAFDLKPIDKFFFRTARDKRLQHGEPRGQHLLRAAFKAPCRAFEACAFATFQFARAHVELAPQSRRKRAHGTSDSAETLAQFACRIAELGPERLRLGFARIKRVGVARARLYMHVSRREKSFARIAGGCIDDPIHRPVRREGARGGFCLKDERAKIRIAIDNVFQPFFETA